MNFRTLIGFTFVPMLTFLSQLAFADPGAVDGYDCHNHHETNKYHCHGSERAAKESHFLVGVQAVSHSWLYDDGPPNIFGGAAFGIEYATNSLALYGNFGYQKHLTGDNWFTLNGWDAGIKIGKSISRIGGHPYLTAGWYSQNFYGGPESTLPSLFSGYAVGAGYILNLDSFAVDARVQYLDTSDQSIFWSIIGFPADMHGIAAQLGVSIRL